MILLLFTPKMQKLLQQLHVLHFINVVGKLLQVMGLLEVIPIACEIS